MKVWDYGSFSFSFSSRRLNKISFCFSFLTFFFSQILSFLLQFFFGFQAVLNHPSNV